MTHDAATRRWRAGGLLAAIAVVILPAPAPAAVAPPSRDTARYQGCHNQQGFFVVPQDRVAGHVPDRYTIQSDTGDDATVIVSTFACDSVTVGGIASGPARGAWVSVQIEPPSWAEPGGDGIEFHEYLLFIVSDNRTYVRWLRKGAPLEAAYVTGIVYDYRKDQAIGPYHVEVPAPSPSPFEVRGIAAAQQAAGVPTSGSWWQDTRSTDGTQWTVRVQHSPRFDHFFSPGHMTYTADEGSELAAILGSPEATPLFSAPHHLGPFTQSKTVTRAERR